MTGACSSAPSDEAVRAAAERLLAAPVPDGYVAVEAPPAGVGATDRLVDGRGVYRRELCSDDSCPILVRWFSTVVYDGPDEACVALSDWIDSLGGPALEQCPPEPTFTTLASDTSGSTVSDQTVVVIDDSAFGNTVLAQFTRTDDGPVEMSLALGHQFCSDGAIAQACVDG